MFYWLNVLKGPENLNSRSVIISREKSFLFCLCTGLKLMGFSWKQAQQSPEKTAYKNILTVCVAGTGGGAHRCSMLLPNLTRQAESQSVESQGKFRTITSQTHSSRTNSDKLEEGRIRQLQTVHHI